MTYANRLNQFIQGIFVTSIAIFLYPTMSKQFASNRIGDFKKAIVESLGIILFLITPTTIGALVYSKEIIMLLFGRGEFNDIAVTMTSNALFFYSFGMIAFGIRDILSRAFYSMQDTKTPMFNGFVGMVLNIVLNIILSRYLGIGGLALATSLSAVFTAFLMISSLRKKVGFLGLEVIKLSMFKVLISSLIMACFSKKIFVLLIPKVGGNLALLLSIFTGAILYLLIAYLLKVNELESIRIIIKNKINKNA